MLTIFEKMFRLSSIAKVAIVLIFVMACSVMAKDKLVIAVSFAPYAYLIDVIGGDKVEVITLLPPGADLRTYKPKTQELKEFSRAEVYFTDGSGADKAWLSYFRQVKQSVKIVDISEKVEWLSGKNQTLDPSVWTSVERMNLISMNVRDALSRLRPEDDRYFTVNYSYLLYRANRVGDNLKRAVFRLPQNSKNFVTTSPLFSYLAHDYKLQQLHVGVSGNDPKSKELKKIVEEGQKNKSLLVFVPPQFSEKAKETIAKGLGAKVLALDPLKYNYLENVKAITNTVNEIVEEVRKSNPPKSLFKPVLKK